VACWTGRTRCGKEKESDSSSARRGLKRGGGDERTVWRCGEMSIELLRRAGRQTASGRR